MNKKGHVIAFEGLDCSFKETNAIALLEHIKEKYNNKVDLVSFPRYGDRAGYFACEYLAGNYGPQDELTGTAISSFYMIDMFDYMEKTGRDLIDNGGIVIIDRCWFSNLYYRLGYMLQQSIEDDDSPYGNGILEEDFKTSVKRIAFGLDLPFPEVVFKMISSGNAIRAKVIAKHAEHDIHEANLDYLKYVREVFENFDFVDFCKPHKDIVQKDVIVSYDTINDGFETETREDLAKTIADEYDDLRVRGVL